jgi:hypothetical protein
MLTVVPPIPCRHCGKNQADDGDGLCTPCRAESACIGLADDITGALENFLDARWWPHDGRGNYYREAPAFKFPAGAPSFEISVKEKDKIAAHEYMRAIAAAYDQVVNGVQRLIQLALDRQVQMDSGIKCYDDGFHAAVELAEEG